MFAPSSQGASVCVSIDLEFSGSILSLADAAAWIM